MTTPEPLTMTVQERLLVLSLASKTVECFVDDPSAMMHPTNRQQFEALARQVRPILQRLDAENPTLLPLPHDGIAWKDRP